MFSALRQLPNGSIQNRLGGDPKTFARLVSTLARVARESLQTQKYIDPVTQARAALKPMMHPRRELTDEERHAIVRHVDRILGIGQTPHDFEHQTPATGIIRLDRPPLNEKPNSEVGGPSSDAAGQHSEGESIHEPNETSTAV